MFENFKNYDSIKFLPKNLNSFFISSIMSQKIVPHLWYDKEAKEASEGK